MRKIIFSCFVLCAIAAVAQVSVLDKSGKKPGWTMEMERGFLVGIGKATDMQLAQDNALLQVKAQIVTSVADNIVSSSELRTVEVTAENISKQFQSFSGTITSQSATQDFLHGISKVNVSDFYWEKLQDKSTKAVYYQYFIKYPFSQWDLEKLVADFKMKDRELTETLEKTLARLNTFTSIEELRECKSILTGLHQYFIDQRKTKAQIGIERSLQLLASVIIRNEGSTLGTLRYALYIDNRIVTFSSRPTITAPCAIIEDRKTGTEVCVLRYRHDECYGDVDNKIKVSYNIPEGKKAENTFYFDINENKAELNLIGTIRINAGEIGDEVVRNATCKVELASRFDSPATITNITLEWKQNGIIIDIPVNQIVQGKGTHVIEYIIPSLAMAPVSTLLFPENKVNGTITYTSGNQTQRIRIYQRDYITSW
ncbi:MAG: hypothetical protein Q7J05_02940 [Paludibacter sp.]|nr:hypothetical protein [Paludibacter sp.]